MAKAAPPFPFKIAAGAFLGIAALAVGAGALDASDGVTQMKGQVYEAATEPRAFRRTIAVRYGMPVVLGAVFGCAFLVGALVLPKGSQP